MDENSIINLAKQGNVACQEILFNSYKPLVNKIARKYFIIGADFDDVLQEGMIGLFNALNAFKDDKNASFKTFATLCINRQIITAIKKAYKFKNENLLSDLCVNSTMEDITYFSQEQINIEDEIIEKENKNELRKIIDTNLSKMEKEILEDYLKNKSYEEIALKRGITSKSVDNALSRIRTKLRSALEKEN